MVLDFGNDSQSQGRDKFNKSELEKRIVKDKTILLLPGSRDQEIKKLLPIMLSIVSEFKNTSNQQCKLAETSSSYIIACINSSGKWTIKKVE